MRSPSSQTLPSRTLPARPSLRHLKLEAKRRLAAGEFATLHDAQTAIAREHGLPSWPRLKQACAQAVSDQASADQASADQASADQEGPALAHLRWVVGRFSGADRPGWTPSGEDELAGHFDDRFLAAIPAGALTEAIAGVAADLRTELVVVRQAPLEVQVQLAGQRYVAAGAAEPPHRLVGLRGFMLGDGITDPRVKAPRQARTLGEPPDEIVAIATRARAELGLPALLLAGGEPGCEPWVVAVGLADLDREEPLEPGHRFPLPGLTALVTATAVLRLTAEGRLDLDAPANAQLTTVRLADDSVTVRDLLRHTGGVDSSGEFYADRVPELAELLGGPVIACGGPRGTVWPSNGGICVLGQLVADVTGMPYAQAAARLVLEPLGMRDSRSARCSTRPPCTPAGPAGPTCSRSPSPMG
jgi:Beta-lactamase